MEEYIVKKTDWDTVEMPENSQTFVFQKKYEKEEIETLRKGHIPEEMEDKWFWYMEGDTLYVHRSWTGFCIYIVRFDFRADEQTVVVNRDPEQYSCTDLEEDMENLKELLSFWTEKDYDHVEMFLRETQAGLEKAYRIEELKTNFGTVSAICFNEPVGPYGFLSNGYLSDFSFNDVVFSSMEKYIMFRKCIYFEDLKSAEKILATDDVALIQKIGEKAEGCNETVWNGVRQTMMYEGLLSKFLQNEDLCELILDTSYDFLVACDENDTIWANGLSLSDDDTLDISKWKGANLLGFTLMQVRDAIERMEEDDDTDEDELTNVPGENVCEVMTPEDEEEKQGYLEAER